MLVALVAFMFLSTLPSAQIEPEQQRHLARAAVLGSFGPAVLVNDDKTGEQAAPIISRIQGRGIFVAWQDARSSGSIYSSTSTDGGATFARNVRVDDPIFNASQPRGISAASSNNGTILVSWEDNRRNTFDYDIFFTKSYDNGKTFAKNVKADDSNYTEPSWQYQASVAITLGGTVYVAWTDSRTGHARLMGAYSLDMGKTFSADKEIAPGGTSAQNQLDLVANGNRIFAAFIDNTSGTNHPYICSSVNGGKTFTAPVRLDNTGNPGRPQLGVSIAPMPNGGVVAVWEDARMGDSDIYAVIVSEDGTVASPNIRVDDDTAILNAWQDNPSVASDLLGNVYVAWQDERSSGSPAIRFAFLSAGKTQFNASLIVSPPGNSGGIPNMQICPSLVAESPGRVYVAWQDDKAGNSDVYVAAGNFPNLYNIALGKGWNFISLFLDGKTYKASTLGLMRGDKIVGWNSSRGSYDQQFIIGISPASQDFDLSASTGYWVYASAPETLVLNGTVPTTKHTKTVTVPTGGYWAAIGFESLNSTRKASDIPAMFSVNRGITSVVSYNPSTGKYSTYIVGVPQTDFRIVPGKGYWCWVVASGVLTYDS